MWGRRKNRGDKWVRVVGRMVDNPVVGNRGDKQMIVYRQMMTN